MTTASQSDAALEALYGKPDAEGTRVGVFGKERAARVKYWRKPDGWITTGPDVMTDAPKYQQYVSNKRYRELPDAFGKEILNTGDMSPLRQVRGQEHRWLQPFIKAGGLTYVVVQGDVFGTPGEYLMPREQIVALNLHRMPGVKELRPDLADAVDEPCPYGCLDSETKRHRIFSGLSQEEAQRSIDQHIIAVHKDAVASRAVGDEISKAMKSFQGSQVSPELIASIAAAVAAAFTQQQAGAIAAVAVEKQAEAEAEAEETPVAVQPLAIPKAPSARRATTTKRPVGRPRKV